MCVFSESNLMEDIVILLQIVQRRKQIQTIDHWQIDWIKISNESVNLIIAMEISKFLRNAFFLSIDICKCEYIFSRVKFWKIGVGWIINFC